MKIYIDAGHRNSTWDRGAVSSDGQYESPIALDYAIELESALKALGVTTYMSRNSEDDIITLQERTNRANALGADLYISIHVNAAGEAYKGKADGVEVLYYTDATLSQLICNAICDATGATNRGAKQRQDLHVLRCSNMQAILIEVGFIDNLAELNKILTPDYKFKIISSVIDVLKSEFNLNNNNITTSPENIIQIDVNGNVKSVSGQILSGVTYIRLKDLADDKIKISYENNLPTVTVI
ncbi:MAG: hypothetical protein BEN18_10230 [Epulopiscium sp. Nuni2H_MBin001]|nr:MAG: hypothetical protein BEN18_10230 [Epulopiscium sp. Nuni2H_MBin001]